jgi:hypothetical protein
VNIAALVALHCAGVALRGKTWAGGVDGVIIAPSDPITQVAAIAARTKPTIVLHTGEASSIHDADGSKIGLTIEVYIPAQFEMDDGKTWHTRHNMAAASITAIVFAQIDRCLRADPHQFSDMFRRIASPMVEAISRPMLVPIENSVRMPACELHCTFKSLADPELGLPLSGVWLEYADACATLGGDDAALGGMIRAVVEDASGANALRWAAASLRLTNQGAVDLGFAAYPPLAGIVAGDPEGSGVIPVPVPLSIPGVP